MFTNASQNPGTDYWRIVCDFDGTITPLDITDAILERFAPECWEDIEEQWLKGAISARECMDRQIGLLEVPPADLSAFLRTVPLTPGFKEFVSWKDAAGLAMHVISDGLDQAIRQILTAHDLSGLPVIANHLVAQGQNRYRLDFPHGAGGCPSGVCKCKVAGELGGKTLLIGDSHSDCCLAGRASFTLARRGYPLQAYCQENGIPHALWDDFFDMPGLVEHAVRSSSGCR